ncbi:T9SS type A sorting domain-containing protein [Flavobacterium sp. H122]|uniref:T9SS type A sorting domain-containing protein n=1 Tax=Flavobacterium sp. H122 TaxID=2529860 RepID=UPI0010AADDF3|nr:T9SS type A sorting domain-containing protein [Flavobacterium sp. H122]
MKQKITLTVIVIVINIFSSQAQSQFWSDTFEDTGAPSSGTRNAENNTGFGSPYTSYFVRTDNTGINTQFTGPTGYQSVQGTKFWAGEDQDNLTGTTIAGTEEQQIDWTGINVSGKTSITFKGLFAANNISASFDCLPCTPATSHSDYLIVEYRLNGSGSYTPIFRFFTNNNIISGTNNKSLALDTDNNDIGDGTVLTSTFTEFEKNLSISASTLDLRIRVYANQLSEEWAIDNFRLLDNTLGVEDFEKSKVLKVYPNPAKDNFKILSQQDASITIYNQLGQTVKHFNVTQNIETLVNTEEFSQGVYFLVGTTSDGKKFNEKIILEK